MSGEDPEVESYIRKGRMKYIYMAMLFVISVAVAVVSIGKGSNVISLSIAFDVIRDKINGVTYDSSEDYWGWLRYGLVYNGTLPRSIGGLLIGATLGICGAVMQACVRNPLASPYTTGISSAALFGVTIYLTLGISLFPLDDDVAIISNAFVFSMVPCILMIFLSLRKKTTPTMLVLIGIGVMYLFNAFTMILKYGAEPDILKQIQLWSIGTLNGIGWDGVNYLIVSTTFLFIFMYYMSSKLDVMSSGENMAHSLGVEPSRVRLICMVVISACTSIAVCFAGAIGFVGLVVPHLSRLFVGAKSNLLLPCSAVVGGLLLLGSDLISRYLSLGLPVGAVTAVIGAPLFLYFLIRMKTNGWGR